MVNLIHHTTKVIFGINFPSCQYYLWGEVLVLSATMQPSVSISPLYPSHPSDPFNKFGSNISSYIETR